MPAVRFRVDPQLARLLGEGYRSSEQALKELVDNAWDADATEVRITLPQPLSGGAIVVADSGTGMTPAEVEQDYLVIARDRRSRKGELTTERKRPVKGRKGIGKFAGLMAADTMTLETRCRGTLTRLHIRTEDLVPGSADLESIDLPVHTESCDRGARGTTVTLTGLNQSLDIPMPERLKPLLMLEYGREPDFTIFVNDAPIGVEDLPGDTTTVDLELPETGPMRLQFTIAESRARLRQSGIAIRVGGKIVGRPTYLGLEDDEDIPAKLLRLVYGELEANGLADHVTADFGAIIENSSAYTRATGWAASVVRDAIVHRFSNEVSLARARRQLEISRRLEQLPEHKRYFAERAVERALTRFYGEKEERLDAVVGLTFDALEYDEYWAVVKAIDETPREDVATFATALDDFGLVDMAQMAAQAGRRLEFLDRLDALLLNTETTELEIHRALEHNLWVLGAEYAMLSSNQTLRRIIERFTSAGYRGDRGADRPDLLLLGGVSGKHLLIEFKRPSMTITREHEAQATAYRDELRRTFEGIEVMLVGRDRAAAADPVFVPPGFKVTSYAALVSRARAELEWLRLQLTEERRQPRSRWTPVAEAESPYRNG
jgi:hypothetical protein